MNAKQLTALAVLAAVSVAATALVLRTGAPTVASDRRGEKVRAVARRPRANEITGLTVRDGADTLAIERRDNRFVAADSGYPIKIDPVRDLVAQQRRIVLRGSAHQRSGALRRSRARRSGRQGRQGRSARRSRCAPAGGELASFVVGSRDATVGGAAGGVFIRLKGQPQTFLARGNVQLPSSPHRLVRRRRSRRQAQRDQEDRAHGRRPRRRQRRRECRQARRIRARQRAGEAQRPTPSR